MGKGGQDSGCVVKKLWRVKTEEIERLIKSKKFVPASDQSIWIYPAVEER